jgi:hypothetical protein
MVCHTHRAQCGPIKRRPISRSRLVADETMPPPVKMKNRQVALWDRLELDAAFDNLKDQPGSETVLQRRLREM